MSWVEAELREQPVAIERFLAAESARAAEIVPRLFRPDVHYLLIVSLLAGVDADTARTRLSAAGGVVREAVADVVG